LIEDDVDADDNDFLDHLDVETWTFDGTPVEITNENKPSLE